MKVAIIHAGADSIEEFVEAKEIESNLDTYYSEIGCDCIEIPERCIGGKLFNIICDEEGLLKDHPIPSAVGNGYQETIFGNLIVCGLADDDGELTGITDEDVQLIRNNIHGAATVDGEFFLVVALTLPETFY